MKPFVKMLKRRATAASLWRDDNPEMAGHGYVLFYRGNVCGWAHDVINAEAYKWCPGVMAVGIFGLDGPIYQATGGNEGAGANEWSVIWNPAPTADIAIAATEEHAINIS